MEARPGAVKRDVKLRWSLSYLTVAEKEARAFLDDQQHAHAVDLCVQLATEVDPSHATLVDVDSVHDLYELRDKGGVLQRINLRIYFGIFKETKEIVILGCWNKRTNEQVPNHMVRRMRSRLRFVTTKRTKKGGV